MARWTPVPIVGGAYSDDTRPWSAQDTVNYLPVAAERPQGRSPAMLRGAPGLLTFCRSMPSAPVRGLHNAEGTLLAVTGDTLYRIRPDGQAIALGTIPGVGRVSMAHNLVEGGHEVLIATGVSGYVYHTGTGVLTRITDTGFPGMRVVDFVDGYLAGVEPAGRYWFHSDLRKATEYNTLDRQDAEAQPDRIVTLIVSKREVFVLGKRTGQFFRNTGAATGTFQNVNGTEMDVGCASPFSIARLDNTVYWLGNDGIIYRLEGNQERRISVGPVEQAIARCDISKAFAFTYEDRGHKVFYLTFPDGETWGYDVWSGEFHRRESAGLKRWRLNALVKWNGHWIGADYTNGRLYRLDWTAHHEAGEEMVRRRVTGVLHDEGNRVTVNGVRLVLDTGGPRTQDVDVSTLPEAPLVQPRISGNAPDTTVGATYSYAYTVTGTAPLTVSLYAGELPPGWTISSDGVLSGTAAAKGNHSFDLRVVDGNGLSAILSDTVSIAETGGGEAPDVLAITGTLPDGYVGVPYYNASDFGDPWRVVGDEETGLAGTLPPGLTLEKGADGKRRNVYGIPLEAGTFAVEVAATEAAETVTHSQSLTIAPRPEYGTLDFTLRHPSAVVAMEDANTVRFDQAGGILGLVGVTTGKVYAEIDFEGAGLVGIHAADVMNPTVGTSGNPAGTLGAMTVTGVYAVALDAATGKVWVSDETGVFAGDPAAGTGETGTLDLSYGSAYRLAVNGQSNARAVVNFGNSAWTYTPPAGFGGWPLAATPVGAIWDTNGAYLCAAASERIIAQEVPNALEGGIINRNAISLPLGDYGGMRATLGKASGKWQFEMRPTGNVPEILMGLVRDGFDFGLADGIGLDGSADSLAVSHAVRDPATGVIGTEVHTSFGGVHTSTRMAMSNYPVYTFACDFDAGTVDVYRNGTLLQAITGLPAGTWFPALSATWWGRARLRCIGLTHPVSGYSDWAVTP